MPRNFITKEEIKNIVLKLKKDLHDENIIYSSDPKSLAHKYLNKMLDRIEEFRI